MRKNLLLFGLVSLLSLSAFSPSNAGEARVTNEDIATCKVYTYDEYGNRQLIAKCFACNCAALTKAALEAVK
jgi:hypothetical protein